MRFNEIDYKMFTLVFLFFLSMVFAIIGYLIKYLEQYQIIAGYTKDAVTKDKNLKKKSTFNCRKFICNGWGGLYINNFKPLCRLV